MTPKENETDIDNLVKLLDGFAAGEEGRLKVKVTDTLQEGEVEKVHHLGRCDIGSPYATGECFDAPLGDCDR